MASTFSDLKIQLMATGENSGTWGDVTNVNLGTAIEEAITGSANVAFSSADVTLTLINDNASQTARNLRLNLTGTSGGNRNLIVPAIEKVYIINNGLADTVTVKNAAGTGIAVPAGKTMYVFNNGTNVVDAITHLTSLTLGSALPVASGGTGVTTSTGTGNVVLSNSPTLVTPVLGTPSSGTLTNATGLPIVNGTTGTLSVARGGTGITSFGTGVATFLGTPTSANLAAAVTDETGTGALVFASSPALAGVPTTPTAAAGTNTTQVASTAHVFAERTNTATLTNKTLNLANNTLTATSAQIAAAVSDETGTGALVFANSPTLVTPALGTPASGVVTNLTGTASININGTVGASTPSTVASTNLSYTGTLTGGTGVINIGSGQVFKDANGNVGIGTSSPNTKLELGGATFGQTLTFSNTATNTGARLAGAVSFRAGSGYTGKVLESNITGAFDDIYDIRLFTANTGASAERLRIDSSGNVGIGTSSPGSKLHVAGATTLSNTVITSDGNIELNQNGSGDRNTFIDFHSSGAPNTIDLSARILRGPGVNGNFTLVNTGGGDFVVGTNNTERLRINSSGNVGIGTSSLTAGLGVVKSSANENIGSFFVSNTNSTASHCVAAFATATNSTATSNVLIKFGIDNYATASGQINANGSSQAAFGNFSDKRLKQNIVDLPSQLNNICALRPVEFDYIESEGGGHQTGFIAQEMQEVYPDAVGERADGMLTVTGWNKTEACLVKAIQELSAKVDTLQAELNTLKGN